MELAYLCTSPLPDVLMLILSSIGETLTKIHYGDVILGNCLTLVLLVM